MSSIGPLRQFGLFMGISITMNYIVVASLYPFVLLVHEQNHTVAKPTLAEDDLEMEDSWVSVIPAVPKKLAVNGDTGIIAHSSQ